MDIIIKTERGITRMKDSIEIEGEYIIHSSLNGKEKKIIKKCENEEEAKKIIEEIDRIIDRGIKEGKETINIEV